MGVKFKYLLLDWDGCIVDTLPIWFKGMKAGLTHFGIQASDRVIKQGFHGWDVFSDLGVPSMEVFTQKVYAYVNSKLCNVSFNEGVLDTLSSLKQNNIPYAIVTSTEREKVLAVVDRLGVRDFFPFIVARNDVSKHKPHTEPILKAIEMLNGNLSETAIIGDSEVDILAGKNAGITSIWYAPKKNLDYHCFISESELKPDFVICDFRELSVVGSGVGELAGM